MIDATGILIALAIGNTGMLTAIFFRLGAQGSRLDAHETRLAKLEGAQKCSA